MGTSWLDPHLSQLCDRQAVPICLHKFNGCNSYPSSGETPTTLSNPQHYFPLSLSLFFFVAVCGEDILGISLVWLCVLILLKKSHDTHFEVALKCGTAAMHGQSLIFWGRVGAFLQFFGRQDDVPPPKVVFID